MEKLHGKNGFDGNTDTRWGTLFENVISKVMQWNLHAKAIELGAIPGDRLPNGAVYQKFSPDNLMLCKLNKYATLFESDRFPNAVDWVRTVQETAPDPYIIVILEYKCPTKREPAAFIPDNYTWQPRTGVVITPHVDVGLFVDSSFRKCSMADFDLSSKYCIKYFEKDLSFKEPLTTPDCIGFIGFEVEQSCNLKLVEQIDIWAVDPNPERVKLLNSYVYYDLQHCANPSDEKKVAIACRLVNRLPLNTDTCRVVIKLCSVLTSLSTDVLKIMVCQKLPDYAVIEGMLDWGMAEPNTLSYVLTEVTKRNGNRQINPYYHNGAFKNNCTWAPRIGHWQDYSMTNTTSRATEWLVRNLACWVRKSQRAGMRPVGVMCWKLMKCKIVPVIPNYPATYAMFEKAKYAVEMLNNVRDLPEDQQLKKLQVDPVLGSAPIKSTKASHKVVVTYDEFVEIRM